MVLKTKRIHKEKYRNTKKRGGVGPCLANSLMNSHFSEFAHCKFEKYTRSNELIAKIKTTNTDKLPMFQTVINGRKDKLKILDYGIFIPKFFVNMDNFFRPIDPHPQGKEYTPEEIFRKMVQHIPMRSTNTKVWTRDKIKNEKLEKFMSFRPNENAYLIEETSDIHVDSYEKRLGDIIEYLDESISKGLFDDFYIKKVYSAVKSSGQNKKQMMHLFTSNEEHQNWQSFVFHFIKNADPRHIQLYKKREVEIQKNGKKERQTQFINIDEKKTNRHIDPKTETVVNRTFNGTSYLKDDDNNNYLITMSITMSTQKFKDVKFKDSALIRRIGFNVSADKDVDRFFRFIQSDLIIKYTEYIEKEKLCFEVIIKQIKVVNNAFEKYMTSNNNMRMMYYSLKEEFKSLRRELLIFRDHFNDSYVNKKNVRRYGDYSLQDHKVEFETIRKQIETTMEDHRKNYKYMDDKSVESELTKIVQDWNICDSKINVFFAKHDINDSDTADVRQILDNFIGRITTEEKRFEEKYRIYFSKKDTVLKSIDINTIYRNIRDKSIKFQKIHAYLVLVETFLSSSPDESGESGEVLSSPQMLNFKSKSSIDAAIAAYNESRAFDARIDYYPNYTRYKHFFVICIDYHLLEKIVTIIRRQIPLFDKDTITRIQSSDLYRILFITDRDKQQMVSLSEYIGNILDFVKIIKPGSEYHFELIDLVSIDKTLSLNNVASIPDFKDDAIATQTMDNIKTQFNNAFYRLHKEKKTDVFGKIDAFVEEYKKHIVSIYSFFNGSFTMMINDILINVSQQIEFAKVLIYLLTNVSKEGHFEITINIQQNIQQLTKAREYLTYIKDAITGKVSSVERIMSTLEASKEWFVTFAKWKKCYNDLELDEKDNDLIKILRVYKTVTPENMKDWTSHELKIYKELLKYKIRIYNASIQAMQVKSADVNAANVNNKEVYIVEGVVEDKNKQESQVKEEKESQQDDEEEATEVQKRPQNGHQGEDNEGEDNEEEYNEEEDNEKETQHQKTIAVLKKIEIEIEIQSQLKNNSATTNTSIISTIITKISAIMEKIDNFDKDDTIKPKFIVDEKIDFAKDVLYQNDKENRFKLSDTPAPVSTQNVSTLIPTSIQVKSPSESTEIIPGKVQSSEPTDFFGLFRGGGRKRSSRKKRRIQKNGRKTH